MKEHVNVLKDSFVDYAGRTHHFVVAAVTNGLVNESGQLPLIICPDGIEANCVGTVEKGIRISVSICNPEDEFVEKVGVQKDPKFLDNVNTYLAWLNNQNKGKCKKHGKQS